MHYFEVLVAGVQFHGQEGLTYSAETSIDSGAIVSIPLRRQQVLGIVKRQTSKPDFAVKSISQIFALPPLPIKTFEMIAWISSYYPAPLGAIVQLFLPNSLSNKRLSELVAFLPGSSKKITQPPLTIEQKNALNTIHGPGTFILHGETGSGKTRVYAELAARALAQNRSAIITTPEIGLTSQLFEALWSSFGERVIVVHSRLTEVERQKTWLKIATAKEALVVVGPRSALFSPLKSVGLIVVDEAHDNAYKQDQSPHYHATRIAAKLGQLFESTVVLGSATPPVVEYFLAEQKQRPIIRMEQLARGAQEHGTTVTVVDLKDRSQFGESLHLSKILIAAIKTTLARHEQILLFLNRRGTARVVFCEKCGWQATCLRCDLPLVYHGDTHIMRCHTCGFEQQAISSCPSCQNTAIVFRTVGTKAIAEEVKALFPEASVQRFDTDNKRSERIEKHYDAVKNGAVDIIIGTQTLAKGLDLPNLGLVGVIIADTSLYLPDYASQERTYQLLAQVIGRIGRGHRESQAIVQTYTPESAILKAILEKEWRSFYQKELAERKAFLFPPFCHLLKLSCRRASAAAARKSAEQLAEQIRRGRHRVIVEGPAPSFHEKALGKYQWQLVLKAKNRAALVAVVAELPSGWSYDIDPANLL